MATLNTDPLAQFALYAYREQLTAKNSYLLKNEIRLLAQTNGQFVRLQRLGNDAVEAAFSKDPGYLFGESVWHYFGCPHYLIYCEQLPQEPEQCLLVVVNNNKVLIDRKMSLYDLREELSPLRLINKRYMVHLVGDIQLDAKDDMGMALFPDDKIKSREQHDASILPLLPLRKEYQLSNVERAIQTSGVGQVSKLTVVLFALTVVLSALWFWPHWDKSQQAQKHQDAYAKYELALRAPEPGKSLAQAGLRFVQLSTLPGWVATRVDMGEYQCEAILHSLGGSAQSLIHWANVHGGRVQFSASGASIILPLNLPSRPAASVIFPLQKTMAALIDRLLNILPDKSVSVGTIIPHTLYRTAMISINVKGISPDTLNLVSKELTGLPIRLQNSSLTVRRGLLTGNINLIALGN
jgi:hypothetical protein